MNPPTSLFPSPLPRPLSHARAFLLVAVLSGTVSGAAQAGTRTFGDRVFTFPDDYTLEIAASPPLVERPIEAGFDDQGRLYVTESSGSNDSVEEQLRRRPHRVLRLTDEDHDGVFDTSTVFAAGLMFPEGVLWFEGSLYVAACPEIWKFTDTSGDGVADQREVWFDGKTLTGCANDLHGPYLGPDGWFYWCKGAFAEQTYDLPGRPGWTTRASHVFRARPDASAIEPVFTSGMDNPVGLAWTPEGDLIVAGTFLQHPGGGKRDGLIHAVYGGVWGKDHEVLAGHPRTGPLLPAMTHLGPSAPCGITRYGRDLLVCQFNMRKVSRHLLEPDGSTWRTEDSDFLHCEHPDFHPTDVLQAPDGSVLVIDTGGWYKLCCPTSQLAKPEVPGAIYRLRRSGGEIPVPVPPPRWTAGNPTDYDEQISLLQQDNPHLRRRAAEALGRLGNAAAIPRLLAAAAQASDRFLQHAVSFALIQLDDSKLTREGLHADQPRTIAAAIVALDQSHSDVLTPADVLPHLDSTEPWLREAAFDALDNLPAARAPALAWALQRLAGSDAGIGSLSRIARAFRNDPQTGPTLAEAWFLHPHAAPRQRLLQVFLALEPSSWPAAWNQPLAEALADAGLDLPTAALDLLAARSECPEELQPALSRFARDRDRPAELRLRAFAKLRAPLEEADFAFLARHLEPGQGAPLVLDAARGLAGAPLTLPQRSFLARTLAKAGPLETPVLIEMLDGQSDESLGLDAVQSLEDSGALRFLSPETLDPRFSAFPRSVKDRLAASRALLSEEAAGHSASLATLAADLPTGDPARGSLIFQDPRTACATCHQIGYKGGTLGPDLSRIGSVRTRADLLESIAFPGASFVRSYEPVEIRTRDGDIHYGIIRNQGAATLTLALGPAIPDRELPLSQIESVSPGRISLMPAGLDQLLPPTDLADLLAFLESLR
ncbi:MAG TPA: PVC-type heme-binding CxxCH protein [Verrucomicrobiales bacterium]|nr:PVC-type heme-binding CxxCH protein [Verrucomicrobiales bacterium]